jgi:hypothetical protein
VFYSIFIYQYIYIFLRFLDWIKIYLLLCIYQILLWVDDCDIFEIGRFDYKWSQLFSSFSCIFSFIN